MKRFDFSRLNAIVVPLLAGVLGLLVGAVMLLALGANPLGAYAAMGMARSAAQRVRGHAGESGAAQIVLEYFRNPLAGWLSQTRCV